MCPVATCRLDSEEIQSTGEGRGREGETEGGREGKEGRGRKGGGREGKEGRERWKKGGKEGGRE